MTNTKEFAKQLQGALGNIFEGKVSADKAEDTVKAVFEQLAVNMEQGEVTRITGFADFGTTERAARKGRNPQTGEPIDIAVSTGVSIKPLGALKKRIKGE